MAKRILASKLAKGAGSTFLLQGAEAGLGFLTSIVLARTLGPGDFGAYAFAITVASLLSIGTLLGFNALAVREVAALNAEKRYTALAAFVAGSVRRVAILTAVAMGIGLLVFLLNPLQLADNMRDAALVGLAMASFLVGLRLYQGFVRGMGAAAAAQFPDRGLRPALFLLLVMLAAFAFDRLEVAWHAVALSTVATAFSCAFMIAVWYRVRPGAGSPMPEADGYAVRYRQALPFALIAGVSIINHQADVLMLGLLSTPEETGVYRVAGRVATIVSFALMAVSATIAPRIAELHVVERNDDIQRLATKAALVGTLVALPAVGLLVFGGHYVLLLFSEAFTVGALALAVLSIGQLVNATVGIVGPLLTMTGRHSIVANTLTATAILNLVLNAVLIPRFGAEGAAASTAVTLTAWNVVLMVMVRRRMGIRPTVWRALRRMVR